MSETVTAIATRVVNASCENVWRAVTEAQYFERWFGAKPGSIKADLRTGGSWRAVVTPEGQDITLEGRYLEVVDHRKLVMTIPNGPGYAEITIVLTDMGDRTEITSSTPVPAEARQMAEENAVPILDAVAATAESL